MAWGKSIYYRLLAYFKVSFYLFIFKNMERYDIWKYKNEAKDDVKGLFMLF